MFLDDRSTLIRTALMFGMLSAAVLGGHALSYGLSDFTGKHDNGNVIWGWLVTYHLVASIPLLLAVFLGRARRGGEYGTISAFEEVSSTIQRQFVYLLVIGLFGLILHWDAKLRLVNGHFDGCWAGVRAIWLNQTARESGMLRIESMLGYLLCSVAYMGAFLSANILVSKGFNRRTLLYFIGFATIGFLSALAIVSRSIMLVLLMTVMVACLFGFISGNMSFTTWARRSALVIGVFAGLSFAVAMGLFGNAVTCTEAYEVAAGRKVALEEPKGSKNTPAAKRAFAKKKAAAERSAVVSYEDGFLDELPVRRNATPNSAQRIARQYCSLCNTVFIYLNHGLFNFGEVLATERRGGYVLLRFAGNWGRQLHILPPADNEVSERVYGRGGPTLPGAAFHDFGAVGVIAVALVHGAFVLLALWLLGRRNFLCLMGVALFVACGVTLAISGLFVAPSLIGFPFVMFSILIWGGLALLLGRYRHISVSAVG